MAIQHEQVRNNHPSRTKFDLSYERKFTADFGYLYPVLCDEMVPGDIFKIGAEAVIRSQPLIAPILHRVDVKLEYFFVPYRLIWNDFEEFITGGEDGYTPISNPGLEPIPPVWNLGTFDGDAFGVDIAAPGSLWDFLYGVSLDTLPDPLTLTKDINIWPLDFPRRAYNLVWWEFYRDENLQMDPLNVRNSIPGDLTPSDKLVKSNFVGMNHIGETVNLNGREQALCLLGHEGNHSLLRRNWEKDFFTSSLPWQQKGDTPALPLQGIIPVNLGLWNDADGTFADTYDNELYHADQMDSLVSVPPDINIFQSQIATVPGVVGSHNIPPFKDLRGFVDLDEAVTFDVSDLRLAFQTQRWLEQNARAGTRYTEFLRAHFGVSPNDARLQRPEFIGKARFPLIISEVLQTSETADASSPQGNMAGHGISVTSEYIDSYHAEEFGVVLGLLSFVPKPAYQQGINKQWLRKTPLDFYFPEFAHLSERAVEEQEIYWDPTKTADVNQEVFGFQGIWDEMRVKHTMVHGLFRHGPTTDEESGFSFWHLGRVFDAPPLLNESFIEIDSDGDKLKRSYPVPSEPPFFVSFGNSITAIRPLPWQAEPGLIDHV